MEILNRSVFCGAALVSELLTLQQIEAALRAAAVDASGQPISCDLLEDSQIASAVLQLGFLNRWQVEQLKAGRTKFTLGPYQVIDSIGHGGMGHVFKAMHSMLGRIEAVKVLPKSKTTPESIASFQREIRAQAQLDHPNLVRLSYAGQDGSTWFFVTEYVPGTDLRRLVRHTGRLALEHAVTIISQAAEALRYAHDRGLVHRDIKPGNLLVTPEGRTKVTDLGLAGYLVEEDDELLAHRAGKIVGTADYLAPETVRAPGEVRPESDIYSLGCTLYYAVTGKVPFPGGTTADKLRRHCDEMPLNPLRFNPELNDPFLDILAGMMDKNPATRIATAADVIKTLKPWTLAAVPNLQTETATAAAQVRRLSPVLPPRVVSEVDTHFLDDGEQTDSELESPSQVSQRTDPVSSALQETVRIDDDLAPRRSRRWMPRVSRELVTALLIPALLTGAIAITAAVLWTVLR